MFHNYTNLYVHTSKIGRVGGFLGGDENIRGDGGV